LCELHGRKICSDQRCQFVDDAAKRAFDIVNSYVAFVPFEERVRSFVALRLSDGGSDGVLYDSRREAVRHQLDEKLCAYFGYSGAPEGFASKTDAAIFLEYHRAAYDAGARLPDPDDIQGGPEQIMPMSLEHVADQIRRFRAHSN
jgi:hypothetical protein